MSKPKKLQYNGSSKVIKYLTGCVNWFLDNHSVGTLDDVNLANIQDGQVLKYDDSSDKWVNGEANSVEANPSDTPTDTLTSIAIDGTVYSVEGGGGGETDLIPLMTSDTTPSGTVSYSSQFGSSYAGYMAFNQVQADISMMTGGWLPSDSDSAPYLQYAWTSPKKLSKLWIETANNGASAQKTVSIEGYNGSSWENCLKNGNTVTLDFDYGQYKEFEIDLNGNNYSAIRISGNEQWFYLNSTACTISRMQAYSISGGISADGVSYDNTQSGLSANKVQGAIDELSDEKADKSTSLSGYGITDAYTKTETDTLLNAKANTADLGTASAKDFTTSVTQNSNDLVTSGAVWTAIDNLPEPMIFKGTLGTNGTITTLPTASSSNEGWTYKVITAGTYAGQSAKVGDLFSSNATEWVYIPSGDESDTDTWRGINVNGSQLLGNGISSGNVNFKSGTNVQVSGSSNDVTVDVDTTFTEASSRVNIASGDSIKTILGKIKKWFADLKTVAFTNSYTDLDNKPTIPTVDSALSDSSTNPVQNKVINAELISGKTATGDIVTLSDSAHINASNVTVNIVAQQLGSGEPSPTNIRPIIGQTEVVIEDVGKNLFDVTNALNGYIYANGEFVEYGGVKASDYLEVEINKNYTLSYYRDNTGMATGMRIAWYDKDKNFIRRDGELEETSVGNKSVTATCPNNGRYARISLPYTAKINKPQFELGSTATTFEPYKGKTYTIQLGDTIYGGTLDVTKGVLTVTHGEVDLGSLTWGYSAQYSLFYSALSDGEKTGTGYGLDSALCSAYNVSTVVHRDINNGEISVGNNVISSATCGVVIKDLRYTDATTFKTAVTGQQLVYELAEPYTIQLTPEQIKLLENNNTIYTNTGDITLVYQPNNMIGEALSKAEEGYDAQIKNLQPTGSITSGDTKAITGGAVYDYHNTTPLNPATNVYFEKSGNVVNLQVENATASNLNFLIPDGYRPKRVITIPCVVYDSTNSVMYSGYIEFRGTNQSLFGCAYFSDGGMAHALSVSDTRYQFSCNTTYIV